MENTVIPPADPANVLFETTLVEEPAGEEASRDGRRLGSRISFGQPAVYDLVTLLQQTGSEPGAEIRSQLDRYDFRLVRLVSTLHVVPRSAVSWFEIRVALDRDGAAGDPPIAYDLFPLKVEEKVQVERTAKISPSFKFKDAQVSFGEKSLVTRYERLEPTITAYGKRETEAYWRYTPGNGSEVAGGVREMDLIVRRPRGATIRATLLAKGSGRHWGIFSDPISVDQQQFDV